MARFLDVYAGLIQGLRPANERCRYNVTPSLIGWAQTVYVSQCLNNLLIQSNHRRNYRLFPNSMSPISVLHYGHCLLFPDWIYWSFDVTYILLNRLIDHAQEGCVHYTFQTPSIGKISVYTYWIHMDKWGYMVLGQSLSGHSPPNQYPPGQSPPGQSPYRIFPTRTLPTHSIPPKLNG